MSAPNLKKLTADIDYVVNPDGGDPKIMGPALNKLLHELVAELAPDPAEGAGTPAITLLSYQAAQAIATEKGAATFRKGSHYGLTNRPTTALGTAGDVLVRAVGAYELASEALLLTTTPDYAALPTWYPATTPPGAPTGETTYTYATENAYERIVPHINDIVDGSLLGDDNAKVFPLPFPFAFGGITYHEVCVDTNGRVVFGPSENYSSQYNVPPLGSQQVPLIAACWTDIFADGPGNISVFCTGQAPQRRFVVDYYQMRYVYNAAYIHNSLDDLQQSYSGQIVLAESDGSIAVGQSENAVTAQYPAFGLQYAGHVYQPYPTGTNAPVNTTVRYTPVTVRAPGVPSSYTGGSPAIWKGQTWDFIGTDKTVEPGTDAAHWAPHAGALAGPGGNTVPVGDPILYHLATDLVARRTDSHNNEVAGSSCEHFPWGMPGVHDNQVRHTALDTSLLTTPGLQFAHNVLADCTVRNLRLAGVDFSHNQLYHVALADYAPATFTGVVAYHGLNSRYKALDKQYFWDGNLLENLAADLPAVLTSFKGRYIDPLITTYQTGKAPVVGPLDVYGVWGRTVTPHDAIEMRGADLANNYTFSSQNFNVVGTALLGFTRIAYLNTRNAPGYTMTFKGLNFAKGISIAPALSSATSGNNIHLVQCTLASIDAYGGGSTAYASTITYSQCVINRMSGLGNGPLLRIFINGACMGRDVTSGSIFPGPRSAANGPLVITNSTIYLAGTATLFDAGLSPLDYPTFRNCTVVAADGTATTLTTNLPLPAAPTALAGTRTAGTGVHLSWEATPGTALYQVYSSVAGAGFQLLATVPYPFFDDAGSSAGAAGTAMQYYIRAANATGPGLASATITVNS